MNMQRTAVRRRLIAGALTLGLCTQLPRVACGAVVKWYVGENGPTSGACGTVCTQTNPCRSITQALACSAPGDMVVVGPGVYSDDLDGDGTPGEPGEEASPLLIPGRTVVSTYGERSTSILITQSSFAGIQVGAAGGEPGVFGKKNKGFHISVRGLPSVVVGVIAVGMDGRAEGNRLTFLPGPSAGAFSYNAFFCFNGGQVKHNAVEGDANSPSAPNPRYGYQILDCVADHNVAAGCARGFQLGAGAVSTNNLAIASTAIAGNPPASESGFYVNGAASKFEHNGAIGNYYAGLWIDSGGSIASLTKNSFYGNATNCGIRNSSGGAVTATNNYWGAAGGPGVDPADDVCNDAGTTTVLPFSIKDYTPQQSPVK